MTCIGLIGMGIAQPVCVRKLTIIVSRIAAIFNEGRTDHAAKFTEHQQLSKTHVICYRKLAYPLFVVFLLLVLLLLLLHQATIYPRSGLLMPSNKTRSPGGVQQKKVKKQSPKILQVGNEETKGCLLHGTK